MQGANDRASSPKPRPPHSISTARQISNRNNNPDVAASFSRRVRHFTLTKQGLHLATTNPFLITDPRLETTPKALKTKARDEF
jgi:hypothetical protein